SSGNQPSLAADSDSSEFELTLEDSGETGAKDAAKPQAKGAGVPKDKEKDIFETDFDVPALEDESGSQVAALDTDLDSSDFDLALGDSDVAAEDESGSQVGALDEEEAEEGAATVAKRKKGRVADEEGTEDFEQIAEDEEVAEIDVDVEEEPAEVEV